MVYFTMRHGTGQNKIYYSYANDDFTALTTTPKVLFEHPKPNVTCIDGDIMNVGGKYHLFYVSHEKGARIKHAISDSLHTGYVYEEAYVDDEPSACEAPNCFKLIGEDKWVVMYDCYGRAAHNFRFSETSDFNNWNHLGYFNERDMTATNFAIPKHGSVIWLTSKEAKRLERYWQKKNKSRT